MIVELVGNNALARQRNSRNPVQISNTLEVMDYLIS